MIGAGKSAAAIEPAETVNSGAFAADAFAPLFTARFQVSLGLARQGSGQRIFQDVNGFQGIRQFGF